jgi:dTMP kinase
VVISDRYIDSSLAYQGAGRTLPVSEISWLSTWATGGLKPDLVVLLDVDPAVGLRRISGRGQPDRLEGETLGFHERVRYAFLDFANADPRRYVVIDASLPADQIAAKVWERVAALLPDADGRADRGEEVPAPPPVTEVDRTVALEPPNHNGNGRSADAALYDVDSRL